MNDNVLSVWNYTSHSDSVVQILPDGCRDLILTTKLGERPSWSVTPLFDQTKSKEIQAGITKLGYRMKPGVRINDSLSMTIRNIEIQDASEIYNCLDDYTHLDSGIEDALEYLACDVKSIDHAANKIGVSLRTLQRLFIRETNRPPVYWLMLARVRKTARSLVEPIPLVELATLFGYADQAHMCREFQRWFLISPSVLRASPSILDQIQYSGYE